MVNKVYHICTIVGQQVSSIFKWWTILSALFIYKENLINYQLILFLVIFIVSLNITYDFLNIAFKVNLSIYLSIFSFQSIYLSICLSPPSNLSIYLSIYLSITSFQSIYLSIYLFLYMFFYPHFILIYLRDKKCIETNRMHVEKCETEEIYILVYLMIYFILLYRRLSTSKFLSEYKNYFLKIILSVKNNYNR